MHLSLGAVIAVVTAVSIISFAHRARPAIRHDERGYISSFVATLVVLWLIVGTIAAAQRHYFSSSRTNCAKAGTITVTVVTGPLNYMGANPKIKACHVPRPSA
jgi:hypothetical protein